MTPEERQFPQFAQATLRGLYKAIISDSDVFLLTIAGILTSSRERRGLGYALFGYVTFRRLDAYIEVVGLQLAKLSIVKSERKEEPYA